MRLRSALVATLMVAGCDPPLAPPRLDNEVYDFRLATNPPAVLRWPSGTTVRVFVAGGTQGTRAQLLESVFDAGARAWNDRALYGEYELVRVADIRDADVVVRWSDETAPVITTSCTPAIAGSAVTTFCLDTTDPSAPRLQVFPLTLGDEIPSRVRMIVTVLGTQAAQPDRLLAIMTHELGHVLGIARHSQNVQDLMHEDAPRATLSPRDAATVQVLYQTRPKVVP